MWSIVFIVSVLSYVHCLTDEEVKERFTKTVLKCAEKHNVDMTELIHLQKYIVPKTKEVKCLLACAYKHEGSMDAKGMYDVQWAYKFAEQTKNGDEKRLENGKKLADECGKVNDIEVSDGEEGCERAAHIFKCVTEKAPKFGFKV